MYLPQFRTKRRPVQAVRFDDTLENHDLLREWARRHFRLTRVEDNPNGGLLLITPEGSYPIAIGDWVVRIAGADTLEVFQHEEFKRTFELAHPQEDA